MIILVCVIGDRDTDWNCSSSMALVSARSPSPSNKIKKKVVGICLQGVDETAPHLSPAHFFYQEKIKNASPRSKAVIGGGDFLACEKVRTCLQITLFVIHQWRVISGWRDPRPSNLSLRNSEFFNSLPPARWKHQSLCWTHMCRSDNDLMRK